jgi:hypothetical protein
MEGLYVATRDYHASVAFWRTLGYEVEFETDHFSGQLRHPRGGPYVFIDQRGDAPHMHAILGAEGVIAFAAGSVEVAMPFVAQHWGVLEAHVVDPDGRTVSIQAPNPQGDGPRGADTHDAG